MGGITAAETVAIFGCGPIGMGFLVLASHFGAHTIVSEPNPYRRTLAEKLGADLVLDPGVAEAAARVREVTGGGADVCVDCTGQQQTLSDALDAARVMGRVGWVGEKPSATVRPSAQVIHKELQMTGSWYFTRADFHKELELYRRGLSPTDLITHRFAISEAAEAYEIFASGETGKVVFCHDV
jgi:propanol-preferring alcohol dehydrogenase